MRFNVGKIITAVIALTICYAAFMIAVQGQAPAPVYSHGYMSGSTMTTLSTSANTVLTASQTMVFTLYCNNLTGSTIKVFVTDSSGNGFLSTTGRGFQIPADSNISLNFQTGVALTGINWWSDTSTAASCFVSGRQ